MRVQSPVGTVLERQHGAPARDDALGEHLTAEDPTVRLLLALAAEQGDVLGERLGQGDRGVARERPGGRQRLDPHLGRPQLLEVEGRQEVEEGCGLLGRHRRNDSQPGVHPLRRPKRG